MTAQYRWKKEKGKQKQSKRARNNYINQRKKQKGREEKK